MEKLTLNEEQTDVLVQIIGMSNDFLKDGNCNVPRRLNWLLFCLMFGDEYQKSIDLESLRNFIYKNCFNGSNDDVFEHWMEVIFPNKTL